MVAFPNCKINLGLNIISKRADGYHDLETVFYPIPLCDALEVVRQETVPADNQIIFTASGLNISGNTTDNLCVKAYELLCKDYPGLAPIQMYLHKVIPMGAGLGGGSADGAFALQLLNNEFALGISDQRLQEYALELGSDCPFFIFNKPCFATGRGEKMVPIELDLSDYSFVIVNPGIHINTGWAFKNITPAAPAHSIETIIKQPVNTWKNNLLNDFEAAAIKHHSAIGNIKQSLYNAGAIYASMTGSGSTVFGIFEKGTIFQSHFPKDYFVYQTD